MSIDLQVKVCIALVPMAYPFFTCMWGGKEDGKISLFLEHLDLIVNFICEPTWAMESPNEAFFLGMSMRVVL